MRISTLPGLFTFSFITASAAPLSVVVGNHAAFLEQRDLIERDLFVLPQASIDSVRQTDIQSAIDVNVALVPSLEEMKRHLTVLPHKSLFFSIGCHSPPCLAMADERAIVEGLNTVSMSWDGSHYPEADEPGASEFFGTVSLAFSEMASGVVHVLLPKEQNGTDFPPSYWAKVEWPALLKNKKVKQIIKLNSVDKMREVLYSNPSNSWA